MGIVVGVSGDITNQLVTKYKKNGDFYCRGSSPDFFHGHPLLPPHKEVETKPDPAGFVTSMIHRKVGKPEKRGRNIITKYLFQILTKLSLLVCLRNP